MGGVFLIQNLGRSAKKLIFAKSYKRIENSLNIRNVAQNEKKFPLWETF